MMRSFVRRGVWLSIALAGCKPRPTPTPPAAPSHVKDKPVSIAGALPVAPFVAEELVKAGDARVVVYVGAKWCEPCQRFHDALHAGALDDALRGVRFVEYDLDLAKDALAADGYRPQLIPLFALPAPDGRAGDKKQEGSIKGEGALQNIMPRLRELLGR